MMNSNKTPNSIATPSSTMGRVCHAIIVYAFDPGAG